MIAFDGKFGELVNKLSLTQGRSKVIRVIYLRYLIHSSLRTTIRKSVSGFGMAGASMRTPFGRRLCRPEISLQRLCVYP